METNTKTGTVSANSSAEPKFKRSKDRSNIINFNWGFDKNLGILANYFVYTAGSLYQSEKVEDRHVPHILIGYYVRRAMNLFVGERGNCAVRMPLTKDFSKRMQFMNTQRFILYLPKKQEISPSLLVVFNQLCRMHMRLACDVYTIIYTRWAQMVKDFSYAVVDMSDNVEEQLYLLDNIKNVAPEIKSIAKCKNIAQCRLAFEKGIDYCSCHEIPPEICLKTVASDFSNKYPDIFSDTCETLLELCSSLDPSQKFGDLIRKYYFIEDYYIKPYLSFIVKDSEYAQDFGDSVEYDQVAGYLDGHDLRLIEAMTCVQLLSLRFMNQESRMMGRNDYPPTKMALLQAKIWDSFVKDEAIKSKYSLFTLGVVLEVKRFAANASELKNPFYELLIKRASEIVLNNPAIKNIYAACNALRKSDLEEVEVHAKNGGYTGTALSYSLENGLIWMEDLLKRVENSVRIPETVI